MSQSSRWSIRFCIVLLTCLLAIGSSAAAPYEIRFHSGPLTPAAGYFDIPASAPGAARHGIVHELVQLDKPLQKGQRSALARDGIELLAYLPDRAYVAAVRTDVKAQAVAALGVRHVSPMLPQYKLHPRVTDQSFGPWSEYTAGRRVFAVEIMSDVPLDDAAALLKDQGCEVGLHFEAAHTVLAAFEPYRAAEIAGLDAVLFIDEAPPPMSMVNDVVRTRLHVNEVQAAPYNLSGQGTRILVYDGGMVDSTHTDFGDRVTWSESGAVLDHSTHVAGTTGGSGQNSTNRRYRGMAPSTRIISGKYDACVPYCLYESPNDFEPDYTQARENHQVEATTNSIGANIDPNSYNCDWFGDYETTSRLLDRLVSNTVGTPLIMFFAAGNERNGSHCGNTSYRCMSVPAGAKNIITCGSTSDNDAVSSFSSWGPTDDGRTKPEVCANGETVTSTIPGNTYGVMSGTSMATPATAGVGLLILEQWHTMFPGAADPLPETMKAILINSTTDIGPVGVDYQTGFGLVNALTAIQNLQAGGVLESALEIGETFESTFNVPAGLSALDVSLAWSDIPALGNVIPTLVNDLDLLLIGPDQTQYLPWTLRPNTPSIPAATGVDSINVCERVHVASPASGQWTLRVTGTLNGSESQTFGLAANVALTAGWATIAGDIVENENLEMIPGRVTVAGGAEYADTDTSGHYTLVVPGGNTYTLRAVSFGYLPVDCTVAVATGLRELDFVLGEAANGTINGSVSNQFGPLPGAIVTFRFPQAVIPPETTSVVGTFQAVLPGAAQYEARASYRGLLTEPVNVFVPENGDVTLTFALNDPRFAPAGPDGYGYSAYETVDALFPAVYDWMEISPQLGGPGTVVHGTPGNDWIVSVDLPFAVQFYGATANQIQVGADGWVRFGPPDGADSVYRNIDIPNARLPNNMVCVFWDDLYPYDATYGGDISYYHDEAGGRFIVEYDRVPHYNPRTNQVTTQLIVFDTAVRPTLTGDNELQIQYQSLDYEDNVEDADASVGIENGDGTVGIQLVFDGTYDPTCFPLGPGYAVRFTTGSAAYGWVVGHITMVPPPPDMTQVTVTLGTYTTHPDADGDYAMDSVGAGAYAMAVTYTGYEQGQAANVVVMPDDTTRRDFTLYRLDPARNLSGQYDSGTHQIHLAWDWPAWHDQEAALGQRSRGTLDEWLGFEVWLSGSRLDTVSDTTFTYQVTQSRLYDFWVKALYTGGTADTSNHYRVDVDLPADPRLANIPTDFYLKPNYPNPFNPTTRIEFGLPRAAQVKVEVFDVTGRRVAMLADGVWPAGVHTLTFDGRGLGSGLFFLRMEADHFERVQKMLLVR